MYIKGILFNMGSPHSSPVLACVTVTDTGVIVNTPVFENNLWVWNWE